VTDQPVDDAAIANPYYRKAFDDLSLGTEEEFSAAKIKVRLAAGQLIGVVSKADQPLVLITSDLRDRVEGDYGVYTIELRTTPTEIGDGDRWTIRRRARQIVISAIEKNNGYSLPSLDTDGYTMKILNEDHAICDLPSGGRIGHAGRQSTIGIPAADIGAGMSSDARHDRRLHQYLQLPWYREEWTQCAAAAQFTDQEKIGFALVLSAACKLVTLPRAMLSGGRIDTATLLPMQTARAKNAWSVRPRTPPAVIFDTFPLDKKVAALKALDALPLPAEYKNVTSEKWELALAWIHTCQPLGGHKPDPVTIKGRPAMLFEYRTVEPPVAYDYAFWRSGEF
jgi:hypothetical protein